MTSEEIEKAGGHAFPGSIPENFREAWDGITARDYFAAQYMTAALEKAVGLSDAKLTALFGTCTGITREQIGAALAYKYADEMLNARSRR